MPGTHDTGTGTGAGVCDGARSVAGLARTALGTPGSRHRLYGDEAFRSKQTTSSIEKVFCGSLPASKSSN